MAKDHNIVYPEYLDADTPDEIVKAVRQNALFGATVIKICVDCKPWGYSVDEIKLFISEAAKAGLKVEGHVQTRDGARRAIDAGIWSIAHDNGLDEEMHRGMAAKGIFRAGTETPISLTGHTNPDRYARTVAKLKNAYDLKVPLTFSTDIIRAMTVTGYKVSETLEKRGLIKTGLAADLIAVEGNPLERIDALRSVKFVMKNGMVFKRDGVMTPEKFFHGGPVKGWRIR
jgi:imidazolonepropionase-like amidohydrolase